MSNGANSVHIQLRTELEDYIKSQYFGKSPLLLSAINPVLDNEGLLYKKPYIESSPAYKSEKNGIQSADIPNWVKDYFAKLAAAKIGVFPSPFVHQIRALEAATRGENLFVATGTGSGKTECFMWPLLQKLADEARNSPETWEMRGVRTVVMYPMNALVSDQVSRLRRLIGDKDNKFISIFRDICGAASRRPQFGMYTGRTPYAGPEPNTTQDRKLEKTLACMSFPKTEEEKAFFKTLSDEGKIPAKTDMKSFLSRLHESRHIPDDEDAELITRFEMQQFCPDILITNYSMLEYMLLRPREAKIWNDTKKWLNANPNNKLLFIIDEAHMYRGSSGGEVALLIRRLFHKLGISRDRVQFILTTASMPDANEDDRKSVMRFANELTAADNEVGFCYLTGEREQITGKQKYDIPFSKFETADISAFEGNDEIRLKALISFWSGISGTPASFDNATSVFEWMYDNLIAYRPFYELIKRCRGTAVSLGELANEIFPKAAEETALKAVGVLLAIAPLAKSASGAVLFPARMHMLFKGISGVYACANPNCKHAHSDSSLTLGEIFLTDSNLMCPECGSVVYELFNDRRCGALYFKGYVLEQDTDFYKDVYLWRYHGQLMDKNMKELHLYIPPEGYYPPSKQGKNAIKPCYLDIKSGFINFIDDSLDGQEGIRKLYYCNYSAKGRPQIITFPTCPHCRHTLSSAQLTSFSTRGNQSFYNLIQAQFLAQPAVPGKDNDPIHLPNEGRKVLLFSDSRQRAAKLARDMSEASDVIAARQLFAIAINLMESSAIERSMNDLYDYFCLAAGQHHVQIFHEPERKKFAEDCDIAMANYERCQRRKREYTPRFTTSNAPVQMQEDVLRMFAGGYNTLYDSAICWIDPTDQALFDAVDGLEDAGIEITEEEFVKFFNAWIINICDSATALGHTISDEVRLNVRPSYGGYGLDKDWNFSKNMRDIMGWKEDSTEAAIWRRILKDNFLDSAQPDNGRLYVDLSRVKPRFVPNHGWCRCEKCSEITPYLLKDCCPSCGSTAVHEMEDEEYAALNFWRKPVESALNGDKIQVIDTEEHTAQLSHKDQRDDMWSKTESYELRFQDLIQDGQSPVDILSSTTTMEVGIDIGSLVAVGLRNIPPMRENYQQRAGRAGRRGSSLSTIVTFCEDGPHDTQYFNDPVPMFRGDPRRPWIDIGSEKLLRRHICMVIFQEYLLTKGTSLDMIAAWRFLDDYLDDYLLYASKYKADGTALLPRCSGVDSDVFVEDLKEKLYMLKQKRDDHPELFDALEGDDEEKAKSLLDALYEEGIIPTYSFPKNVVSTYISGQNGQIIYEVDRGLDVAIGEYAPGRSIVVDKRTYQIGGLYYPKSEMQKGQSLSPAKAYINDPNYLKPILTCPECNWFGLAEDDVQSCPFCGNSGLTYRQRKMLRPWGFAPRNGEAIPDAQLNEEYSAVQTPLYSTLPDSDEMRSIGKNIRIASRTNQRIIMMNNGPDFKGFMVCSECGAAMPGDSEKVLDDIKRPYKLKYTTRSKCRHSFPINVDLGYDFVTDMLVLEFALDQSIVDARNNDNPWLNRAAQSLAEALRLAASKELDIEFTELVTGYRFRKNALGSFVDVYLYDSLSSGAGYSVSVAENIEKLLTNVEILLTSCDCSGACQKCLKHYRNQNVQGQLDRHAALDLLKWGIYGYVAPELTPMEQESCIAPLVNILMRSGCKIISEGGKLIATRNGKSKIITVYPAMWAVQRKSDTVFINSYLIKYAKPYAVQQILDEIK